MGQVGIHQRDAGSTALAQSLTQAGSQLQAAGSTLMVVLSAIIPVLLSVVASALLQGVIVMEVARASLGEKLKLGQLWRAAGKRLWPLVGWTLILAAALLVGVGVIGGAVALLAILGGGVGVALAVVVGIIGGLGLLALGAWLYTRTSLVPSLIVLERLSIRASIRRSWSLTIGYCIKEFVYYGHLAQS